MSAPLDPLRALWLEVRPTDRKTEVRRGEAQHPGAQSQQVKEQDTAPAPVPNILLLRPGNKAGRSGPMTGKAHVTTAVVFSAPPTKQRVCLCLSLHDTGHRIGA